LKEKGKMSVKTRRSGAFLGDVGGKKVAVVAIGGLLAGLCNGLLGAGGGIVVVLALSAALPDDEDSRQSLYANALCVMLPLSLLTLATYALRGDIPDGFLGADYALLLLGAAIGGLLGALITDKLSSRALKKIFAALTVLAGVLMVI
jgi:uncharacterized membrane protein YfcA